MVYLTHFEFPPRPVEEDWWMSIRRTCYDSIYPFYTLSERQFQMIDFEPVTILYGGNGSGKSTALNVIAEKLHLEREALYNRSNFFEDYLGFCSYKTEGRKRIPENSRIITSDDVFDFMITLRGMNQGVDLRREELLKEYLDLKGTRFQFKSLDDYDMLKKSQAAKRKTQSRFVRLFLQNNVREHSNGESAIMYFEERIKDNGLYLVNYSGTGSQASEAKPPHFSCLSG